MSKLKFLRIYFHQLFGMHNFSIVKGKARCSCGVYLKKAA